MKTLTDGQNIVYRQCARCRHRRQSADRLDGRPKANTATLLTDVVIRDGETYSRRFVPGVLTFTGEKGGRTLAAKQLTITSTTNVADLLNFMNQAMGIDEDVTVLRRPIRQATACPAARCQFVSNTAYVQCA